MFCYSFWLFYLSGTRILNFLKWRLSISCCNGLEPFQTGTLHCILREKNLAHTSNYTNWNKRISKWELVYHPRLRQRSRISALILISTLIRIAFSVATTTLSKPVDYLNLFAIVCCPILIIEKLSSEPIWTGIWLRCWNGSV